MSKFKIGDSVVLKSEKVPVMTVNKLLNDEQIECIWHDNNNILQREKFHIEALNKHKKGGGARESRSFAI